MFTHIYALRDPESHQVRYVGKTRRSPETRLRHHLKPKSLATPTHKNNWLRKILRKGFRPVVEILEIVPHAEENKAERKWIAHFRGLGESLTNGTDGGDGGRTRSGFKLTEKQRKALHDGLALARQEGRIPPHQHTKASKAKMSKAARGRTKSEAHRRALSESHKGKTLTPEHRLAISRGNTGRKLTEDHKRRISEAKKGRFTPAMKDTLRRASEVNRGRVLNVEHRIKIRNSVAKLNENSVRDIRDKLEEGETLSRLARIYGVVPSTIRSIRDRKTWVDV